MKIHKNILYVLLLSVVPVLAHAQKKQEKPIATCEFKVQGVCEMCKARIEEAALIRGVKMAEWDKSTSVLKAIYRKDRVSEQQIHEAIAAAGHETDQVPANQASYDKLPKCCAYNDGIHKH